MKTVALVFLLSLIGAVVMASEPDAAEQPVADAEPRRGGDPGDPFTTLPDPECPRVCPFIHDPVCAVQLYNDFMSFSNECVMRRYNCDMATDYQVIYKGNCEEN